MAVVVFVDRICTSINYSVEQLNVYYDFWSLENLYLVYMYTHDTGISSESTETYVSFYTQP